MSIRKVIEKIDEMHHRLEYRADLLLGAAEQMQDFLVEIEAMESAGEPLDTNEVMLEANDIWMSVSDAEFK